MFKQIIQQALKEDIGKGDITTDMLISPDLKIEAVIIAKEKGVIAGLAVAKEVFKAVDKKIIFKPNTKDAKMVFPSQAVAYIKGRARSILSAERTALNFLSHLSGIATLTGKFSDKVRPYKVKIFDTRKTLPGLRQLQKYAVRSGGGFNHRFSLDDMVLIKDNHIKAMQGCLSLPKVSKGCKIEIEVNNLKEFKDALKIKPDIIMLDNMKLDDIKKAVKLKKGKKPILEVSGGINLKNVSAIARTGIDRISVGALTHSAPALDFSLEIHG